MEVLSILGRLWDERREAHIVLTISDLIDEGQQLVDSEAISRRLHGVPQVLGSLSKHEHGKLQTAGLGLSEAELLVLYGLTALKRDGLIAADSSEVEQWPYILRYERIALTRLGRKWEAMLRTQPVGESSPT